jgi:ParB family chromosome partitioning protein
MTKKTGLGRGLEALIATDITQAPGSSIITELPISQIAPNPRQPRSIYDHVELASLASSIRDHGLIQPLVVSRHETIENQYTLIAGERRLIAAKEAGLSTVPALIREVTDQQRLVLALIENLQLSLIHI